MGCKERGKKKQTSAYEQLQKMYDNMLTVIF